MSTLLEKLNKEELVGVIANNPDASWELVDMCIKNRFIIPDTILNSYLKDHPIFSEKEIPSTGLYILINRWHLYAYNLLRKNIDIPEIVLKAVSKHIGLSSNLIGDFIDAKKNVPEILIKSISSSPSDSYWVARYFIERNKKAPEILNQSIAKEPMLLQTYKQFLREIEVKKKVNELYASKEEVKESVIVNEKLDKDKLLEAIAKHIQSSEMNPRDAIDIFDKLGEELLKYGKMYPYEVKNLFIKMGKKPPYLGSPYFYESTIINEKLDKNKLLDEIIKDANISYGLIVRSVRDKREFPEVLYKGVALDPSFADWEAARLMLNKKDVPDILIKSITSKAYTSLSFARRFWEISDKEPPEIILDGISKSSEFSLYYAKDMIQLNQNVPEVISKGISKNYFSSALYADALKKAGREVPDIILKTNSEIARLQQQEYEKNKPEPIEEKLNKEELLDTVFGSWHDVQNMIFDLSKMGKEIPDKLAILAAKNMRVSVLRFLIEDIIAFGKNKVPEIMLKSISKDKKFRNIIAMVYKNYNQEIPKIIMDSLNSEQKEFYNSVWFTRKKPIEEKLDKNELLDSVGSNLDKTDILNFAYDLLHINKELPDNILKIVSDRPNWAAHHIINIILKNKTFDTTGKDLHILLKSVSEDVYQSGELIKSVLRIGYPDVPDVLLKSIARNGLITKHVVDVYILKRKKIPIILQKTLEAFKQKHPLQANNLGMSVSESQKTITEALDKEKLKQVFLKNPNAVVKYAIRNFLEKGVEPPEEFIEAISQGSYASKTYIDAIIHWTDKKIPQEIIQGVLKSSDIAFEIFKDPELKPHFSKEDLEKSIANNSSNALGLYKIYKKENKKISMVIWKSITQSSTASLYLARDFVEAGKIVPNQLLRGISTNVEKLFIFSIELLKNNLDLPDVLLNALSQNADSSRVFGDFDKVLFQYVKGNKEIPQILLDAAANRSWRDKNLSGLCYDLASKGMKIPDAILDIFIKNTPKSGYGYIGSEALKIILYYLEKEAMTKFENIPTKLYKYIVESGISNHIKILVEGFMKTFGKVPEEFKKAILDYHDKYSKRKYIPQDIAKAIGINESAIIEEKLDKDTLLNIVAKKPDDAFLLFWNFKKFRENPHDIPEKLKKAFTKNSEIAFAYAKHIILLDSSAEKIPPFITKAIAKDARESFRYAQYLINLRVKIPKIILKGISSHLFWFNKYNSFISDFRSDTLTDSRWKDYFKQMDDGTLMEKLDKEELLGVIQKDYDAYIDIMNHYFWKKEEYPPEEFLKMATETDEASRIFAEYCLEHKKDIPDDVIKKVAENPRSAYTIAALMILEERKVPEILIKSIHSDPLSLKQFREFAKNEESRFHIPTSYYAKI